MRLWVQRFLTWLRGARNFSPHTLRAYAADLGEFEAFWKERGDADPARLSRHELRAWLARLSERSLKRASVLRKASSLRSFARFLRAEGVLAKDPFLNVPLPKRERRLPKFLSESEAAALLDAPVKSPTWLALRDKALLELLYSSGLRRSELVRLNVPDVDFLGGVLRVFGKGSRERVVPAGRPALKAIRAYLEERPESAGTGVGRPLWVNQRGRRLSESGVFLIVRRLARAAGLLKPLSPHTLRHSFATQLLGRGCDLRSLQEMLGHKSLQATQVYTHTTLERIRKVYEGSHPRAKR